MKPNAVMSTGKHVSGVSNIDVVLANLPATSAQLWAVLICHVDYDDAYLDTLLRDMRDAGLIACVDGLWYKRAKSA